MHEMNVLDWVIWSSSMIVGIANIIWLSFKHAKLRAEQGHIQNSHQKLHGKVKKDKSQIRFDLWRL